MVCYFPLITQFSSTLMASRFHPPPHFFLPWQSSEMAPTPNHSGFGRCTSTFLSLPESLRTRVVLWKSVSPPSAKRHRTTAAAAIAAAQSSFTEFKTCCLICVYSTERERGLFSAHSFSLSTLFRLSYFAVFSPGRRARD